MSADKPVKSTHASWVTIDQFRTGTKERQKNSKTELCIRMAYLLTKQKNKYIFQKIPHDKKTL